MRGVLDHPVLEELALVGVLHELLVVGRLADELLHVHALGDARPAAGKAHHRAGDDVGIARDMRRHAVGRELAPTHPVHECPLERLGDDPEAEGATQGAASAYKQLRQRMVEDMVAENVAALVRDDGLEFIFGEQIDDAGVHDYERFGVAARVGVWHRVHFQIELRLRNLKRLAGFAEKRMDFRQLRRTEPNLGGHVDAVHHILGDGLHVLLHERVESGNRLKLVQRVAVFGVDEGFVVNGHGCFEVKGER